jgi:hypothetical protein
MLKTVLAAVLLTGLATPIASAASNETCLYPPTADKTSLCAELLFADGNPFGVGRFAPTERVPGTLTVAVWARREMWPQPLKIAEKSESGLGELKVATDPVKPPADARSLQVCATARTELGTKSYEVCTPWQDA